MSLSYRHEMCVGNSLRNNKYSTSFFNKNTFGANSTDPELFVALYSTSKLLYKCFCSCYHHRTLEIERRFFFVIWN